jgi:transcriptional regulator of acetoin/glycerol metabolism
MAHRDDKRMVVALVYGEFHLPETKRREGPIWWKPMQNFRNRVLSFYQTHPGCSPEECAQALGISRKTVYRHLRRFRAEWAMQSERKDAA